MKKILNISLALMTLAAVSCVKEDINDNNVPVEEGTLVIEAATPADVTANPFGTKTTMAPNGENYSVLWSADDAISVNGAASSAIEIAADNAKSATFTVSGVAAPCCAVYPAAVASDFTATSAVVTLPATQNYAEGSFDPEAAVMLGYMAEEEGTLAFSHAMTYLYLTVNTVDDYDNDNIRSVSVKSLGTEPLSGAFDATFGAEGCTMAPAEGTASTEVTLDCGAQGVAKGTPVVVALPAGTYASGLVITITDVNGHVKTQKAATELELKAGYVYTATLRVAAPGIYNVAGYNAFAAAVNAGDYSAWVNPEDGEVNLYADLVSDEPYTHITVDFAGKFDGNKHTRTCTSQSLPMFTTISAEGEVKNLNLVNTFTSLPQFGEGAFSGFAKVNLGLIDACSHTVTLKDSNFETDSDYDINVAGLAFGGFVWANGGTIQNSTMNGTVNIEYKTVATQNPCYGGGFAALGHTVTPYQSQNTLNTDANCVAGKFIRCVNNANIKVHTNNLYTGRDAMGGICGLVYLNGVEFSYCENAGKVERTHYGNTSEIKAATSVGGILGQGASWYLTNSSARESKKTSSGKGFQTKISNCTNAGTVSLVWRGKGGNNPISASDNPNTNPAVGGIVGAIVGNSSTEMAEVSNCKTTGVVNGACWSEDQRIIVLGGIAGIASYATLSDNDVDGTVGSGKGGGDRISTLGAAGGIVGTTVNGVNISGGSVTADLNLIFDTPYASTSESRFGICLGLAQYKVVASSIKNVTIAPKSFTISTRTNGTLKNPTLGRDNYSSYLYGTLGAASSLLVIDGNTWAN